MKIFKVTLYGGYCYLEMATSYENARKQALSQDGSANVQHVEIATDEDVAWVRGMGGKVPELPTKPSEWAKKGYYVVDGWTPKVGERCDFYNHKGEKRPGIVKEYNPMAGTITIDEERIVLFPQTFTIRYGR